MTRLFASLLLWLVVPGLAVETVPLAGSARASPGVPSAPDVPADLRALIMTSLDATAVADLLHRAFQPAVLRAAA